MMIRDSTILLCLSHLHVISVFWEPFLLCKCVRMRPIFKEKIKFKLFQIQAPFYYYFFIIIFIHSKYESHFFFLQILIDSETCASDTVFYMNWLKVFWLYGTQTRGQHSVNCHIDSCSIIVVLIFQFVICNRHNQKTSSARTYIVCVFTSTKTAPMQSKARTHSQMPMPANVGVQPPQENYVFTFSTSQVAHNAHSEVRE